jgi:PHD/YefM family antitoxin component YafN of YafNO toxin-antitoxin module
MTVYTYSQARQKLAALLEQAARGDEVKIKRKDGRTFVLRPETKAGSPLDAGTVDLGLSTAELVQFIREGKRSAAPTAGWDPSRD